MSFSKQVKTELLHIEGQNTEYLKAELAGLISVLANYDGTRIILSHNKKLLYDYIDSIINQIYSVNIQQYVENINFLEDIFKEISIENNFRTKESLLYSHCGRKGFLKGIFIGCGYLIDPNQEYHLEFETKSMILSTQVKYVLEFFEISAKIGRRKQYYFVYIKDAEQISDFLKILNAVDALFLYEDIRIIKNVKNNINRKVNCEIANMNKVINTAIKQINDINFLLENNALPKKMHKIAEMRLTYNEASLKELGEKFEPTMSKSKVNYNMKKISQMAERLRGEQND